MLARQGGDPDQLDLEARLREHGGPARPAAACCGAAGPNLGQLLVFPGFVNLLTVAVVIDLVVSGLQGDHPAAAHTAARSVLIAILGLVHLVHQIRAAAQGFQVLRRLG